MRYLFKKNIKYFYRACVLCCACAFLFFPYSAKAQVEARSAILMDMGTGKILYEQNADDPIPPASLTKVLTMYMAFERVRLQEISLQSPVRISKGASRVRGSRMGLMPSERVPLENLLLGMAVSSGNDATAAVAEFLGGTQQRFVQQMNAKALELGLRQSIFANPHGMPAAEQYTTARDMLLLGARYVQEYPHALRLHSTRFMRHNGIVTYNKNPLLGNFEGADGLKTGWIRSSGYNLISTAKRGNTRLLAVVMGSENDTDRARAVYRLMEAGFLVDTTRTIEDILPTIQPQAAQLSLDKTKQEAYTTLAPETLKPVPKRRIPHKKNTVKTTQKSKKQYVQQRVKRQAGVTRPQG